MVCSYGENTVKEQTMENGSPSKKLLYLVFAFTFIALVVDGADVTLLAYSLSSLKDEFGLSSFEAGSLASFTLLGMMVGGIYGGWACDRFGRVKTISWSIALFSIGTCALGFTNSYWEFAIVRFIASMPLGAVYLACNILTSEYFPSKNRSTVMSIMLSGYIFGSIVAALLAGSIIPDYGWRWVFYVSIIPIFIALLVQRYIPEPTAWFKLKESKALGLQLHDKNAESRADNLHGLRRIWSQPGSRLMLIIWTIICFFLIYGYYGVNVWMPSYLEKDLGMNFKAMTSYMIGSYVATMLGKVVAGVMADRLGRRFVFCFGCFATAAFLLILVNFNSPSNIFYLLIFFGFVYGSTTAIHTTYLTESFDTPNRGMAAGLSYNIGRLGGAIAPPTIGLITTHSSFAIAFFVIGVAYVITAIIPAIFVKDRMYDPQSST